MKVDAAISSLLNRFESATLFGYAESYRYRLADIPEDEFIPLLEALRRLSLKPALHSRKA
jgi:hypothetical protein